MTNGDIGSPYRRALLGWITVGFHNFNLRIFNLRISNPNKLIVHVCLTRCRISKCQGLGPTKHYEITEIDRNLHSIQQVFERSAERVAQPPWLLVRTLPLQQRLLAASADTAIHAREQKAENSPNLARRGGAGIFLDVLPDKVNGFS